VSAVIWATGFRLDHALMQLPVCDADGRVEHRRGVTAVPGLYFLGLPWLHTRGSALLGWVKDDAEYLSDRIAEHAAISNGTADARRATAFELRLVHSAPAEQPSGTPLTP
jgi:putative flavoprotein involved in K+ transport